MNTIASAFAHLASMPLPGAPVRVRRRLRRLKRRAATPSEMTRAAVLASVRSVTARATYTGAIMAFCRAGRGDLLLGPNFPEKAITETVYALGQAVEGRTDEEARAVLEVLSRVHTRSDGRGRVPQAFVSFCRRNPGFARRAIERYESLNEVGHGV